jgi:hypothetical protein
MGIDGKLLVTVEGFEDTSYIRVGWRGRITARGRVSPNESHPVRFLMGTGVHRHGAAAADDGDVPPPAGGGAAQRGVVQQRHPDAPGARQGSFQV